MTVSFMIIGLGQEEVWSWPWRPLALASKRSGHGLEHDVLKPIPARLDPPIITTTLESNYKDDEIPGSNVDWCNAVVESRKLGHIW